MAEVRPRGDDASPATADVVSLFSGAGGLDAGLERAGWSTVAVTDIDRDSIETLRRTQAAQLEVRGREGHTHLQDAHVVGADVHDVKARDLRPQGAPECWRPSLLVGGPPCQPWSSAGHQRGLADPRGQLFPQMTRLIDELKPRFVLFENVRGLLTALGPTGRSGEVLEQIQSDLGAMGYASRVATLNAADYGAAQRRVRLLLLATSKYDLPHFPQPTHSRTRVGGLKPWTTLGELLDSLPEPDPTDVVRPSGPRAEALQLLTPGTGLKTGGRVESNRPSGHWGYRQDCFLADPAIPSRTIRAAATPDWIREADGGMRRLTWRECAALQGFPSDWQFAGTVASRFKQIGNAVQVDLAHALGEQLLDALELGPAKIRPVTPAWAPELVKRTRYTAMEHRVNGKHRIRVRAPQVADGEQMKLLDEA